MNRRTFLKMLLGTPAAATVAVVPGLKQPKADLRMTEPGQTVSNVEVHGNLIIEAGAEHASVQNSQFTEPQPGFTDER